MAAWQHYYSVLVACQSVWLLLQRSDYVLTQSVGYPTFFRYCSNCMTPFCLWTNDCMTSFCLYPMITWHRSGCAPWLHDTIRTMPNDCMTPFRLCPMTAWHYSGYGPQQMTSFCLYAKWTIWRHLDIPMTGLHSALLHDTILDMRNDCIAPFWLFPMTAWHHFDFEPWLYDIVLTMVNDCITPFWLCPMNVIHQSAFETWLHDTFLAVPPWLHDRRDVSRLTPIKGVYGRELDIKPACYSQSSL